MNMSLTKQTSTTHSFTLHNVSKDVPEALSRILHALLDIEDHLGTLLPNTSVIHVPNHLSVINIVCGGSKLADYDMEHDSERGSTAMRGVSYRVWPLVREDCVRITVVQQSDWMPVELEEQP